MEVAEADHVLDAGHRRRVHRLDAALRRQPLLFAVVVNNLKMTSQSKVNNIIPSFMVNSVFTWIFLPSAEMTFAPMATSNSLREVGSIQM